MIRRRTVLKTLAGLPLAAILADPRLARAQAMAATRLVSITTASGRDVAGALALPDQSPAPGVILIHEWWGLNDHIKAMAAELSRHGFVALAVDLFQGRVTGDPQEARALVGKVEPAQAVDTLESWVQWLKNHNDTTRQVALLGWCFGGGWALRGATSAPVDAAVIYYGRPLTDPAALARLRGPVLAHFGRQDQSIPEAQVHAFQRAMAQANQPLTLHWYDAGHAFANPSGANYDQEDARQAWQRTLDFLRRTLTRT